MAPADWLRLAAGQDSHIRSERRPSFLRLSRNALVGGLSCIRRTQFETAGAFKHGSADRLMDNGREVRRQLSFYRIERSIGR